MLTSCAATTWSSTTNARTLRARDSQRSAITPTAWPSGRREAYKRLVTLHRAAGDKGFAHKSASEFPGPAGRMRQRAYFDAFRDLAAPTLQGHPALRVASPEETPRWDSTIRGVPSVQWVSNELNSSRLRASATLDLEKGADDGVSELDELHGHRGHAYSSRERSTG